MESAKKLIGVVAFFVAFFGVKYGLRYLISPSVEKELVKVSKQINEECPMMVDADTRLEYTEAGPGKHLTYYYTLINLTQEDLEDFDLETEFKPEVIDNINSDNDMKAFREHEVEVTYVYDDKGGNEIGRIEILASDYL